MSLTRPEFEVLKALTNQTERISESDLDRITGFGPEEVDAARESLISAGLMADDRITAEGIAALEPFRVKNAIIQAAGLCTRFAPVSYDMHKGLIRVDGVPLVERQICQLLEAGVTDITLVVGHKKEMYTYLGAKYGVDLVENPDYALFNTMTTMYHVRDRLSRTYILFSDTYFTDNPFDRYVWEGFYATAPVVGHTEEWIYVPGPDGYVVDMVQGGDEGEYVGGFACLDETIVSQIVPILEEEYGKPEPMRQYWETMWYRNMDKVLIKTRCLPKDYSHEFDTMDELRAYDPTYLDDVNSPSLDNICRLLSCKREDIYDCHSLNAGLTNLSCHFAVGDREYVYRHPVGLGGRFIDRADETKAEELAKRLGLDRTYIHEDPVKGWKVSRYIPNARCMDEFNDDELRIGVEMLARLHKAEGLTSPNHYSRFEDAKRYEKRYLSVLGKLPEGFVGVRNRITRLQVKSEHDGFGEVFSHNDAWYANFLVDEMGGINLIDWEFAMMADEGSDMGYFLAAIYAGREKMEELLTVYLGHEPDERELRHYAAHAMIASRWQYAFTVDWKTSAQLATDWPIDTWLVNQRKYMEENLDWIEALYEGR